MIVQIVAFWHLFKFGMRYGLPALRYADQITLLIKKMAEHADAIDTTVKLAKIVGQPKSRVDMQHALLKLQCTAASCKSK